MAEILKQLGVDSTYFIQFAIFLGVFFILGRLYFKPVLKQIQLRNQKTIQDAQAAAEILNQATAKMKEYEEQLKSARQSAQVEMERILKEARKEEADLISTARDEAKRITQEVATEAQKIRETVRKDFEKDADQLAQVLADKLIAKKSS